MDKKLFRRSTAILIILSAGGVYSILSLFKYIDSHITSWNNDTYQVFIQTAVVMAFLILFSLITVFLYHQNARKNAVVLSDKEDELEDKNRSIEALNEEINSSRIYDTSRHIAERSVLMRYIDGIYRKNIEEFTVVDVSCSDADSEKRFLSNINYTKGRNVEVFAGTKELTYTILLISTDGYDAEQDIRYFITGGCKKTGQRTFDTADENIFTVKQYLGDKRNPAGQTVSPAGSMSYRGVASFHG